MGGAFSYYLSLENPEQFKGAILLAPALKNSYGYFTRLLTNILTILIPNKPIIPTDKSSNFRNPDLV